MRTVQDETDLSATAAPTSTNDFTSAMLSRTPSLVLVAIGVTFLAGAAPLEMGSLRSPGPGMWPTVAACVVILLGLASCIEGDLDIEALDTTRVEYLKAALAFAEVLVVVAAFWALGYFAAAFIAVTLMAKTFSEASWRQILLVAVAFGVVLQILFGGVLLLPPPNPLPWSG